MGGSRKGGWGGVTGNDSGYNGRAVKWADLMGKSRRVDYRNRLAAIRVSYQLSGLIYGCNELKT